jgi:hypothetical protein
MPRASSMLRPLSLGSMTVNRFMSSSKCRSINGSMPLPIEPKPIIAIGPVMRP